MRNTWFRFIPTTRLDHYRHATRPWPRAILNASDFDTRDVRDSRICSLESRDPSDEAREGEHVRERCVIVFDKFYVQERLTRCFVKPPLVDLCGAACRLKGNLSKCTLFSLPSLSPDASVSITTPWSTTPLTSITTSPRSFPIAVSVTAPRSS